MLTEFAIELREATTRYVQITCKDRMTGEPFDLAGYDVQTWVSIGANKDYVPNAVVENIINYKIPAEMSLGARRGVAETRIFKNGDVFEVLRANITVYKAEKPDLIPNEGGD